MLDYLVQRHGLRLLGRVIRVGRSTLLGEVLGVIERRKPIESTTLVRRNTLLGEILGAIERREPIESINLIRRGTFFLVSQVLRRITRG